MDFYRADLRLSYISDLLLTDQKIERSRRIINDIQNRRIREEALSRFWKLETGKLSLGPQSLKDAIICQDDDLANLLGDTFMLNDALAVDCGSEHIDMLTGYCEKLKTFLSDLVHSDETGHIRKAIEKRNELAESLFEDSSKRPADLDCNTIEFR